MRVALLQMTSGDDPRENLEKTLEMMGRAGRADLVLTPEVTNCVSTSRDHQLAVLRTEDDDLTLKALRAQARSSERWVLIGSLALKTDDPDARFANRSFLISPTGKIAARYDKIHMFDVTLSDTETYRESLNYRPGHDLSVVPAKDAHIGLSICYDLRFPSLYGALARAGADIICVPSAFAVETGRAHWETLLRARAIETGAFVLAPAQCGDHSITVGRGRQTYGHSLVVDPWGRVLADGGTDPGIVEIDLNLELVREARQRIPSLTHSRPFKAPNGRH